MKTPATVNLIEHIYKGSDFISNEHELLETKLLESSESHCKIMDHLSHITYCFLGCVKWALQKRSDVN